MACKQAQTISELTSLFEASENTPPMAVVKTLQDIKKGLSKLGELTTDKEATSSTATPTVNVGENTEALQVVDELRKDEPTIKELIARIDPEADIFDFSETITSQMKKDPTSVGSILKNIKDC